jgi:acid phosphatase family membrane protein YuiD
MVNTVIIAAGTSWFIAQSAKVLFGLMKYGMNDMARFKWRILLAGGMPSSHSAFISSTTLTILLSSGADSLLFGMSLVMSCIVVYDVIKIHAIYDTFQKRYPEFREEVKKDPVLKDLVGHRLPEVIVGVLIGLCVGLLTHIYY